MRAIQNANYRAFMEADQGEGWGGVRLKEVRGQTLRPGGRAELTLFEQIEEEGRPHPRLRLSMPLAKDPSPRDTIFKAPEAAPKSADELEALLLSQQDAEADYLAAEDLDMEAAPKHSERFYKNTIARQRRNQLFDEAQRYLAEIVDSGALPAEERDGALYRLRALRDLAFAEDTRFDDHDTRTYHSYGHDAPFVHYLEAILKSLPEEASEGLALLPAEQAESVRRQRAQARNHLDHLMRRKYAYHGITESDIERSLGGFLIERESRLIVSEKESSRASLVPEFELLRISPTAEHEKAGEWVYRDEEGKLRLQDHSAVEGVEAEQIKSRAVSADDLTFRRAPEDPNLRKGMRLDWNNDGYVQHGPIGWISWAGHCDLKAVVEQLGVTMADKPSLTEYRSDSGQTLTMDHELLLEMFTSALELGSHYQTLDGTDALVRGIHRFGGYRNDSRPDRLQFQGPGPGKSFRWPVAVRRQEAVTVTKITGPEGDEDMESVFSRLHPDPEAMDFKPNPRYLKTIEGDYNLIDVSGALLEMRVKVDTVDEKTGYLKESMETTTVDLRPEAKGRSFLGTHIHDAAKRELFRVYIEREEGGEGGEGRKAKMHAVFERWVKEGDTYKAVPVPEQDAEMSFTEPLHVTLSREMKSDDPEVFQELLTIALHEGVNINADTDAAAEVWNGTVTRIHSQRLKEDRGKRTEHWRVDLRARFGNATLEYLLRRREDGVVDDFCPIPGKKSPDFLWQDFPDVGSKGVEGGRWIVNETMVERDLVEVKWQPEAPGGYYVFDDHIKNAYEMLYAALGGYPYTVVHNNKRWGFQDEEAWKSVKERLEGLRAAVKFKK